jgi:MFS family permease
VGLNVTEVGHMMAAVIFGAMVLQYPVGRWSDRKDRQTVLIILGAACAVLSVAAVVLPPSGWPMVLVMFLLGGGVFAVYPVAVSHAADSAPDGALVRMIQGLLLINSLGSAVSPMAISPVMTWAGPSGLFWAFAVINLGMVAFFVWRRRAHPVPVASAPFAAAAQYSATGVELRMTQDLAHAVQAHEADEEMAKAG